MFKIGYRRQKPPTLGLSFFGALLLIAGIVGTLIYPICGLPLLVVGVLVLVLGVLVTRPKPIPPPRMVYVQQPTYYPPPPPPQQVVQREVIREIVKVPCRYCGALVEMTARFCPNCYAPMR